MSIVLTLEETAALQKNPLTLAVCWVTQDDAGNVSRYTSHDQPVLVDKAGLAGEFVPTRPLTGSEVSANADLSVDNLEITVPLAAAGVTQAMIRAGIFDSIRFTIFLADWASPHNTGIVIKRGVVGNVRIDQDVAVVFELRSLKQYLQQQIVSLVSRTCRARLGQTTEPYKCGVDLAPWTDTGVIATVSSRRVFTGTGAGILDKAPEWYRYGLLTLTSGANAGLAMEVKRNPSAGAFELLEPLPFDPEVGDAFEVYAGCDHSFAGDGGCGKFGNQINFQGEPDAPDQSELIAEMPS